MMLLVDTSVWSYTLRRKKAATLSAEQQQLSDSLAEAIDDGRVAIIGPIRQELLSGIKDEAQFEKLKRALEPFPDEVLSTSDYEEAARLYNVCRSHGAECGAIDILICSVATRRGWGVLTADEDIKRALGTIAGAKSHSKGRHSST